MKHNPRNRSLSAISLKVRSATALECCLTGLLQVCVKHLVDATCCPGVESSVGAAALDAALVSSSTADSKHDAPPPPPPPGSPPPPPPTAEEAAASGPDQVITVFAKQFLPTAKP